MSQDVFQGSLVMLIADDFNATVDFYTEKLGFEVEYRGGNDWAQLAGLGLSIGIHGRMGSTSRTDDSGRLSLGLRAASIEAAVGALRERGVEFVSGIEEDAAVPIARFHDPDGTHLYVFEETR